jgi:hypothetical protein
MVDIETNSMPAHGIEKLRYSFACARTLLIQEALYDSDATGFQNYIEDQFPHFFNEVNRIREIFHVRGYDSPGKQRVLLLDLYNEFRLQQYISAVTI